MCWARLGLRSDSWWGDQPGDLVHSEAGSNGQAGRSGVAGERSRGRAALDRRGGAGAPGKSRRSAASAIRQVAKELKYSPMAQKWLEGLDAEIREAVETESGSRATETIPLLEERLVPQ